MPPSHLPSPARAGPAIGPVRAVRSRSAYAMQVLFSRRQGPQSTCAAGRALPTARKPNGRGGEGGEAREGYVQRYVGRVLPIESSRRKEQEKHLIWIFSCHIVSGWALGPWAGLGRAVPGKGGFVWAGEVRKRGRRENYIHPHGSWCSGSGSRSQQQQQPGEGEASLLELDSRNLLCIRQGTEHSRGHGIFTGYIQVCGERPETTAPMAGSLIC
jgi:hypothetical protein